MNTPESHALPDRRSVLMVVFVGEHHFIFCDALKKSVAQWQDNHMTMQQFVHRGSAAVLRPARLYFIFFPNDRVRDRITALARHQVGAQNLRCSDYPGSLSLEEGP